MNFVLGLVLVLGVTILVHEWGHFIVARLFGVRVDVFSIGFGPRLFGKKWGATDWRVSLLPLGGYVRMAGQELIDVDSGTEGPTGAPDELMSKPRWQRALISFAGPLVNLIFPILLLTVFYVALGIPYDATEDQPAKIAGFPTSAPVNANGPQVGDRIVAVNGVPTNNWGEVYKIMREASPSASLSVTTDGSAGQHTVSVSLSDPAQRQRAIGYEGLAPIIDEVLPGEPANRAGVREGDRIVAVNGQKIQYWEQFTEIARASKGQSLQLDIERKGQPVHIGVTPALRNTDAGESVYQIGVGPYIPVAYRKVSFGESIREAGSFTWLRTGETIGIVGKLFSGRVSVKQLQSVVGISRMAGQAVSKGPLSVVMLMAFISVNLGILNLLPIPILDGGHILLLAIEGGLRRDLSLAFKERFVQVGFVFLLVLFAYVMYNDVSRLLPIHH